MASKYHMYDWMGGSGWVYVSEQSSAKSLSGSLFNRPFARSGHMVRNKLHWDANYAVDFQNKGKSGWTGTSSFVLKVPLRNLRPSVIYSVLCDRIVQRAYWIQSRTRGFGHGAFDLIS